MRQEKKKKFRTVLLADSNSAINNIMRKHIENEKIAEEIITSENRVEQEKVLRLGTVDVLVTGLKYKGVGIVKFTKEFFPETKIVICSGSINSEDLATAMHPNVFIRKPITRREFIAAFRGLLL